MRVLPSFEEEHHCNRISMAIPKTTTLIRQEILNRGMLRLPFMDNQHQDQGQESFNPLLVRIRTQKLHCILILSILVPCFPSFLHHIYLYNNIIIILSVTTTTVK